MDPEEQFCKGLLKNAEINPRIPIHKLNEYKARCSKYGYDKQFDDIINIRNKDQTNLSGNQSLPVTNKPLLPVTNKPLLPVTNKPLLPVTNKNITNKIDITSIKLPEPLWNWEVEKDQPPIPIKYPVYKKFDISAIEEWRRTIAELSLVDRDLEGFNVNDLIKLFDLYNIHFFNNSLPKTTLDISNRFTVKAGQCAISRNSVECKYAITISRSVFTKLNLEENQVTKSGGLVCKSRLNCLQLVLEHELIHLIMGFYYPNRKQLDDKIYSSHGLLFKSLVKNYFGQTESTHQIGNIIYDGSDNERILLPEEIKIGQMTAIIDKKGIKKGIIVNIYTKNIGIKFLDGDSWKVGSDFLHKISDDDDDYSELVDLKNEILSKFDLYKRIKLDDTVKFYFDTKDNTFTGKVVKLNNKSSKLSIASGTKIYTIVYPHLIEITKTTETNKNKSTGEYTIKDFRIGDKVVIAGGKRSDSIYGTIIKLNRVNAKIKSGDTIWNAPYSILSFYKSG